MRRTWAAVAATLCCLMFAGVPVVAQEGSEPPADPPAPSIAPPEAAYVTGKSYCSNFRCTEDLSDPRVSGEGRLSLGSRCWVGDLRNQPYAVNQPGCTSEGTMTIVGPDGRWIGPWAGLWDDSLRANSTFVMLVGTGAYEGWTFIAHILDADVNGVIYRGRPPRMQPPEAAGE